MQRVTFTQVVVNKGVTKQDLRYKCQASKRIQGKIYAYWLATPNWIELPKMNVQQETRQYLASRLQGIITTMTALTIESFAIAGFIILEFPLVRTGQTADYVPILQCHINE